MLARAKKEGLEAVLLVEDDIQVMEDFVEIYARVSPELSRLPWDMLYFGSYLDAAKKEEVSPNLLRVQGCAGWHAVAIRNRLFGPFSLLPPYGPMDWMTAEYAHPHLQVYAIHPSIIVQKSGYSHVEGGHLTKPSRYE